MKKLYYILLCALAAVSCQDEIGTDNPSAGQTGQEIRMAVGNLAQLTRSTNPDIQNTQLFTNNSLGMFILHENVYHNAFQAVHDVWPEPDYGMPCPYDSTYFAMPAQPTFRNYGYLNTEAYVNASGNIFSRNGVTFCYPFEDIRREAALIAYAPYNRDITLNTFINGFPFQVAEDQSTDEAVVASDLLLGTPKAGNTFRTDEAVLVDFQHQLSRLSLEIKLTAASNITNGKLTVCLDNVPVSCLDGMHYVQNQVSCILDDFYHDPETDAMIPVHYERNDSRECIEPVSDNMKYAQITMATISGITMAKGETRTIHASAIAVPGKVQSGRSLTYTIKMNGEKLALKDKTTQNLNAGEALAHKCDVSYDETKKILTATLSNPTPDTNGREYVDLGLPSGTLWATMNVGADNPEDYGDYFAWGETTGYSSDTSDGYVFDWTSYKWCNGSRTSITKYCTDSSYGTVDNKTELDLEDDAANVLWGGDWRIPSNAQIEELCNIAYTTTTSTTTNGVSGVLITSKSNGKSIFLPSAGFRYNGLMSNGSFGFYTTRSLYSESDKTYVINTFMGYAFPSNDLRSLGFSVRPACSKE